MKPFLVYYLIVVNVLAFLLYGIDKRRALRHQWRIPESTLLALAAIGGSVGAWLAMRLFHHKTRHNKFRYGVPLLFLAQVALFIWRF